MLNSEKDFTNELSTRIDDCNEKMFSLQKRNQKYRVLMWDISSLGNFILIVLLVLLYRILNLQGILCPKSGIFVVSVTAVWRLVPREPFPRMK